MKPGAAPKAMVSSSPGRAENLQAPGLARLLRGNGGSRSRARSSPMFVSRSKSVGRTSSRMEPTLTEEGEPSSPKVTCIGQVRIRKNKSNSKSDRSKSNTIPQKRCRCFERALLCKLFPRKPKAGVPHQSLWRRWGKKLKEPDPIEVLKQAESESVREEEEGEKEEEETRVFVSSATPPPPPPPPRRKNALLLMRCRSAPHNRSSALATARFPVSPLPASETPEEIDGGDGKVEEGRGSCNGSSRIEEEVSCSSSRPLALTRCKSEPAKKAAKMMAGPEVSYCNWNGSCGSREGRLGMVQEEGPPTPAPPLKQFILHIFTLFYKFSSNS